MNFSDHKLLTNLYEAQKENFKTKFADIVKDNVKLFGNYKIQFFNTLTASNYVIYGPDGKSMNVMQSLTVNELDKYVALKNGWLR